MESTQHKNNKKSPELLAPAGSFGMLKAVIHAGADAVYLAGSQFGARAYAENFAKDQLLEAIDYAHLHGCRLYLAVNTLLKQDELDSLYDYLLPFYNQGLDAAIVQDFGVMKLIRQCFPSLAVHASTQMSIAGSYGVSYLNGLGVKRIVPARELSLDEIRNLRSMPKTKDMEIECFVHGALCYCYSGQCLLSSLLGGRSGNRGRCAQPCRLPYTVLDENHKAISDTGCFPLSPKDLSTIGHLPQLIGAGIDSFKIEGRMKSPEYAAGVTAIYRKYIDLYIGQGIQNVQSQDFGYLLETGNRSGFTDGYYFRHNGPTMITLSRPSHEKSEGAYLGTIRGQYIEKEKKIPIRASARFQVGKPAELTVWCGNIFATAAHGIAEAAKKQPMSREMLAAQLCRTGNTPFITESIEVQIEPQPQTQPQEGMQKEPPKGIFLPKQELNKLRRKALECLQQKMLEKYRRQDAIPPSAIQDTYGMPLMPQNAGICIHHTPEKGLAGIPFMAAIENENQLLAVLDEDFITRIYLSSSMYTHNRFTVQLKKHAKRIKECGKQAYLSLPAIFRMETAQFYKGLWEDIAASGIDGYLVSNFGELGFLEAMQVDKSCCVLGHGLYTYSNTAKRCFQSLGWETDTAPLELNKKELLARDNLSSELIIYGHMPLMVSAQCLYKTFGLCTRTSRLCYLSDRYGSQFPVKADCGECYNTIYNPQPLSLIQLAGQMKRLRPAAFRLHFTTETGRQASQVLNCARQAFFGQGMPDMSRVIGAYTNGHYKRGVE